MREGRQAAPHLTQTVAVQLGTTGQFAMEKVGGINIRKYNDLNLALLDVSNGRDEAAVGDLPAVREMIRKGHPKLKTVGSLLSDEKVGLVMRQGMAIAAFGIVLGVGGAYALSRLTASLLYGVSPSDPTTYAAVAGVIAVVAAAACILPTRRATRVDPLEAIRAD